MSQSQVLGEYSRKTGGGKRILECKVITEEYQDECLKY